MLNDPSYKHQHHPSEKNEERPRSFSDLLLWCSGVSREILDKCPESEVRKYKLLGMAILVPALLGVFSGGYAVYTTFQSFTAAAIVGIVWGFIILTIDRVLVLTYRPKQHAVDNFLNPGLWLRFGLAIAIALTISKPIEMRLFEDTIQEQIALQTDDRIAEEQEPYIAQIDSINREILATREASNEERDALDRELVKQRQKMERLQSGFLAEMDGSGGTLQRGIGPIAAQKRVQLENAEEELWYLEDRVKLRKEELKEELAAFTAIRQREIRGLEKRAANRAEAIQSVAASDMLARLNALHALGETHPTVKYSGWLITLLFVFIELIPLMAKAFMRDGAYSFYVENEYQWYKERSGLDSEAEIGALYEARSFEGRKKADESVLDLRLDLLERQVNHTGDFFRLERRFEDLLRARESEIGGSPRRSDYEHNLDRLRTEFYGLSNMIRPERQAELEADQEVARYKAQVAMEKAEQQFREQTPEQAKTAPSEKDIDLPVEVSSETEPESASAEVEKPAFVHPLARG